MLETNQVLQSRYELLTCLGDNCGRQTWRAKDLATSETVVVKILAFPNQVDWQALKLFEREGEILQAIQHPQIPHYRDFFSVHEGAIWYCLVEDAIPGKSLKALLDEGKHFSEVELRDIAKQVLKILIYLHGMSPPIYHRDIKPSNLIWGDDQRVYLVDFGAVQDKAPVMGATFTVVGTLWLYPDRAVCGTGGTSVGFVCVGRDVGAFGDGSESSGFGAKRLSVTVSGVRDVACAAAAMDAAND